MGLFMSAHRCEGQKSPPPPSLKSVAHILQSENLAHTIIPYLKKTQKYMNHVTALFHRKSVKFTISENTDTDRILVHNFLIFYIFWVFKDFLNRQLG